MSLNIDSREGTGRTDIFTGTTANAGCVIDSRNHGRLLIVLIELHHFNGSCRTMAGAVAALHLVGNRHTILLNKDCMTYLYRRFFFFINKVDSSSRTHLRTARTLRTTETTLVRHLW